MLLTGKDETMTMSYYFGGGGPESRNATCFNSDCAMIENRQHTILPRNSAMHELMSR